MMLVILLMCDISRSNDIYLIWKIVPSDFCKFASYLYLFGPNQNAGISGMWSFPDTTGPK